MVLEAISSVIERDCVDLLAPDLIDRRLINALKIHSLSLADLVLRLPTLSKLRHLFTQNILFHFVLIHKEFYWNMKILVLD